MPFSCDLIYKSLSGKNSISLLQGVKDFPSSLVRLSLTYLHLMLRNNSFSTVDKNASNSAGFVLSVIDDFLCGQGTDDHSEVEKF